MSLLVNQKQTLKKLDIKIGEILDTHFAFDRFFYETKEKNVQYIANTFDIDIENQSLENSLILCEKPLLKKQKIGTQIGIELVLDKIYKDTRVVKTAPYTFKVKTKTSNTNSQEVSKAVDIILKYKPLRDAFEYIELSVDDMSVRARFEAIAKMRLLIS